MRNSILKTSGIALLLALSATAVDARPPGLEARAKKELRAVGLDRYVGKFKPASREDAGNGWDKFTFDTEDGDGPVCIAGTPFTVFHQQREAKNLLIVLDGGGACVQDSYLCSILANDEAPTGGIFDDGLAAAGIDNPFADWSKLFVSYCDGSVFSGDNTVEDSNFPFAETRQHRGIRNLTAAMDLARDLHPNAKQVLLSGISAGGYGVINFGPTVYRLVFPPAADLYVLNDSGPGLSNPAFGTLLQDNDWNFSQFFPASCESCSTAPFNDQGAFLTWTLENDNGYKGALYSTDGDAVIRSFTFLPSQQAYRDLLLDVHVPINSAYPDRYKTFIRSGSEEHTALGGSEFYQFEANGIPLYQWVDDFVNGNPGWMNIIEDFVPAPPAP